MFYHRRHWDLPHERYEDPDPWELHVPDGEEEYPPDDFKTWNDQINHRFTDIVNDIMHYFGFGKSRKALSTESTKDERDDIHYEYDDSGSRQLNYSTRPDLAILGEDDKQLLRPLESYNGAMSVNEQGRNSLYRGCVAFGKVERVQRKELDRTLEKVATCAR